MANQDGPLAKANAEGIPKGQTDWGVFSFGYFSLDKQRKVTRHQGETNV